MKSKIMGLVGLAFSSFFMAPGVAEAGDYCREYTKTISVGGQRQEGYGTACYRPDGSWEIVNLDGNADAQDAVREYIRDDLYRRDNRVVVIDRYPVRYAQPYYSSPGVSIFYNTGRPYYNRPFRKPDRHHHHGGWRDDDRRGHGNGRGHGHGHGQGGRH